MNLTRGKSTCRAVDGSTFEQEVTIERESEKAFLIKIKRPDGVKSHWFPKKMVDFRGNDLVIADWLWDKRQAV